MSLGFLLSVFAASIAVGYVVRGRARTIDERTPAPPRKDPVAGAIGTGRWASAARETGSAGSSAARPKVSPPTLAQWGQILAPGCAARKIPLPYALKWISMESGGNPCAVGYPPAKGPDGNPREMGIAQFYNPDDLARFKLTGAELRAYCVPGDQHEITWKGKLIKGFSGAMLRPLTQAEMVKQADAAILLIARSMASATKDLTAVHAGASWSPTKANYWTLVKLQHGLPGVPRSGMPAVTAYLKRPPTSWSEFRATLPKVTLDAGTEKWMTDNPGRIEAILDNAEECASVLEGDAIV